MSGRFNCITAIVLLALAIVGCMGSGPRKPDRTMLMEPARLGELNRAYADRYVLLITAATDEVKDEATDTAQKHAAQRLKTESALSVYDIVTGHNPYENLLDLTVAVTLQSEVYIDEDRAEADFGRKLAPVIIRAMRQARLEIWDIAAKAMTSEQLDNLEMLIWEFHRNNPSLPNVINVRFSNFANSPMKSLVSDSTAGGLFAPISEAVESVNQARELAERTFYYGKRAPLLLSWEMETNADDMLTKPEFSQLLADIHTFAKFSSDLPGTIAKERTAVLDAFDDKSKSLNQTLASTKETLAQADQTLKSGRETLQELQRTTDSLKSLLATTDTLASKYMPPPAAAPAGGPGAAAAPAGNAVAIAPATEPAHPFDIRDYTKALAEAAVAAKQLNEVLISTRDLLSAPAWSQRVTEIQQTADDRVRLAAAQSHALVDSIFHRVYLAIAVLFLALILYRYIAIKLARHMAHTHTTSPENKP